MIAKRPLYILLGIGILILLIGITATILIQKQNQTELSNTTSAFYGSMPYTAGYQAGYYEEDFDPPTQEREHYLKYRQFPFCQPTTYEAYCNDLEWYRNEYTQGYIEGSMDRKVGEKPRFENI